MLSLQSVGPRPSNATWIDTAYTVSAMEYDQCYSLNKLMSVVSGREDQIYR